MAQLKLLRRAISSFKTLHYPFLQRSGSIETTTAYLASILLVTDYPFLQRSGSIETVAVVAGKSPFTAIHFCKEVAQLKLGVGAEQMLCGVGAIHFCKEVAQLKLNPTMIRSARMNLYPFLQRSGSIETFSFLRRAISFFSYPFLQRSGSIETQ